MSESLSPTPGLALGIAERHRYGAFQSLLRAFNRYEDAMDEKSGDPELDAEMIHHAREEYDECAVEFAAAQRVYADAKQRLHNALQDAERKAAKAA